MTLWQRTLDRSIVFSFDRTGFQRHARSFEREPERDLEGRHVLVTGGTAGIGLAAARGLSERGAYTHVWARNEERGHAAVRDLARASFRSVDLGDLDQVRSAAWAIQEPLAAVILNAGAMPRQRKLSVQGHELIWASQVLGHLLLVRVLHARKLMGPDTRVVWVSSGGMYTQQLDLSDLRCEQGYSRHVAYANAKRAQVELAAELSVRWPHMAMASMHPGWVDTEAVKHSMPIFRALTRSILRTPAQGADTIVWLAARAPTPPSGRFWFDRKLAPEHLRDATRTRPEDRDKLITGAFADTEPFLSEPAP